MARREREPLEMIAFGRRAIRAAGRHAGQGDEFELAELVALRDELEDAIRLAVTEQRSVGRSWAYIGGALGITRQSAQERYGERASACAPPTGTERTSPRAGSSRDASSVTTKRADATRVTFRSRRA